MIAEIFGTPVAVMLAILIWSADYRNTDTAYSRKRNIFRLSRTDSVRIQPGKSGITVILSAASSTDNPTVSGLLCIYQLSAGHSELVGGFQAFPYLCAGDLSAQRTAVEANDLCDLLRGFFQKLDAE